MRRAQNRGAHAVGGLGGPASQRATPAGTWTPARGGLVRGPAGGAAGGHVLSEAEFQQRILDYCRLRGLRVWHDNDSRRNTAGWPDLVIVGPSHAIFRELKTDRGKLRPDQEQWIAAMRAAGLDVAVWRPAQWLDHIVPQLTALARRPRGEA